MTTMSLLKTSFLILVASILHQSVSIELNTAKFPEEFHFAVATSAYQIEGAWDADGKGENIWDHFTHHRSDKIKDNTNGDIACDSYHHLKEDVGLIKDLGVGFYRFSLSWSRILPNGTLKTINEQGIDYYNRLIDELIANNIEPIITLYHWDLPQNLQEYGGWTNPAMEDFFADYAQLAFETFGDRVKYWITFNEPWNTCVHGYGMGYKAPGLKLQGYGEYLCAHTIIKSHARAYRLYDSQFRETFNGKVSITLDMAWYHPSLEEMEEDIEAAERMRQFTMGWFANPIYVNGDYPEVMKYVISERSKEQGLLRSRLPEFTEEEKRFVNGTSDFFAFNTYTTVLIRSIIQPLSEYSWFADSGVALAVHWKWPGSASHWLKVIPWGFRNLLNWISRTYNDPEIFVTENGYSDTYGELEDIDRIIYYELYLSALLDAIDDGVKVKMYTFWSLLDNFEWTEGYEHAFGLYHVDFSDPKRPRTPKKSVEVIKEILKNRQLPAETHSTGSKFIIKDEL